MRLPWFKLAAVLIAIWAIAGGVIFWARSAKTTPESVVRYLDTHPIASAPDRGKVLEKVAAQINQLNYDQRREVRMSKDLNAARRLQPDDGRAQ
jgi:hypothetical protein